MNEEKTAKTAILYVSSVPVTLLYSGASFMYRLFEGHEKELTIFQGIKLSEDSQLKNIDYNYYEPIVKRLGFTRFREIYNIANIARNYFFIPSRIGQVIREKKPNVIITVSNGLLWILAYRIAKKYRLPLVIIIHDDMNYNYSSKKISGKLVHFLFGKIYRYARLRFCISELMSKQYLEKYHVPAEVLYPLQGKQTTPAIPLQRSNKKITVAYAGSLDVGPYPQMIMMLADELKKIGGSVMIFSNTFPEKLESAGNIVNVGFLHPEDLRKKMEENADILFVPFPFYDEGFNVELAFPSKMADYTLIPKPLLIWAPANCAISAWFKSLAAPIGVLVEKQDAKAIAMAIEQLADPLNNAAWGANSFKTGKEYFGNEKQQHFFFKKIREVIH